MLPLRSDEVQSEAMWFRDKKTKDPQFPFLLLFLFSRKFKRVLPLPNGNWNAIVDDWCCHPDPFNKKLLPRAEDCLLGDTFLLLAKDGGCAETLTEEVSLVGSEDAHDSKVRG